MQLMLLHIKAIPKNGRKVHDRPGDTCNTTIGSQAYRRTYVYISRGILDVHRLFPAECIEALCLLIHADLQVWWPHARTFDPDTSNPYV